MTGLPCRLCGGESTQLFNKTVMGKYQVGFHECQACGSLQTDEPYWLDEAYADGIRALDTGAVIRAQALQRIAYVTTKLHRLPVNAPVLDWGAGDGLMVRMLRDVGIDAYHWDPYARNTYAAGFDGAPNKQYGMVTAFEVWEHLPNPAEELSKIFAMQPDIHLATTSLYKRQGPDWLYLNTLTGRHVFFYSRRAIEQIAQRHGYHVDIFQDDLLLFYRTPRLRGWRAALERHLLADRQSKTLAVLFAMKTKYGLHRQDQDLIRKRLLAKQQDEQPKHGAT